MKNDANEMLVLSPATSHVLLDCFLSLESRLRPELRLCLPSVLRAIGRCSPRHIGSAAWHGPRLNLTPAWRKHGTLQERI